MKQEEILKLQVGDTIVLDKIVATLTSYFGKSTSIGDIDRIIKDNPKARLALKEYRLDDFAFCLKDFEKWERHKKKEPFEIIINDKAVKKKEEVITEKREIIYCLKCGSLIYRPPKPKDKIITKQHLFCPKCKAKLTEEITKTINEKNSM